MSLQALAWVFEHSEAEGGARLVLLVLAEHMAQHGSDGEESCWPSVARIAHRARVHRATVHRHLQTLVELGELTIEGQTRSNGSRTSSLYRMGAVAKCDGGESQNATGACDNGATPGTVRKNPDSLRSSAPRPRDPIFDALAAIHEVHPGDRVSRGFGAMIATAKRDLLAAQPDVTPELIAEKAELYARLHPRRERTATAVVKWWPTLKTPKATHERTPSWLR